MENEVENSKRYYVIMLLCYYVIMLLCYYKEDLPLQLFSSTTPCNSLCI